MTVADDLGAWLRLLLVPGLGRVGVRQLVTAFGSPAAVLAADEAALLAVGSKALVEVLRPEPEDLHRTLEATLRWLEGAADRHLLTLGDPQYPRALLESPDPPLVLHVQGDPACLARASIAVVGSRHPTPQGRDNAHAFARALGEAGLVVVSGLALGVDAAAHEGALAAGACTVAVVGTGLDRVYPKRHHALAHRIATTGALVSEYFVGTPPLPENFPQRNRIIAGLSLGTLVVEAALQSGSLITARLANEAGREVFAVPGSIHAAQSRGCHALIRDGAQLVEAAAEIVEQLRQGRLPGVDPKPAAQVPAVAPDPLLEAMAFDPVSLDALQARTGLPTPQLLARLLELELDGRVARLPGGLYQRRASA